MPTPKIKTPLEPDRYYHIYNRGNNKEALFYTESNYYHFLNKFYHYLHGHLQTYAYCLIINHFHFLIKVTSENASSQFQKFFQSYAMSVNYQENRSGSLFRKTFRRILIEDDVYLKWLIFYIHYNPEKHQVAKDFRRYPYCSYISFFSGSDGTIHRDEVFNWFGGKEAFIEFHRFHYAQKEIEKDKFEG